MLGSGDSLKFNTKVYFESQLPVTVVVYSNENIQDGYMTYRDMKTDFNQGTNHCVKTRYENPFTFMATTTCHFDHE